MPHETFICDTKHVDFHTILGGGKSMGMGFTF